MSGRGHQLLLHPQDRVIDVAIKQFTNPLLSLKKSTETDHVVVYSDVEEESAAWSIYTNSSREGRMMYQLQHTHILGLVGVAFQPLRLLLELAPRGDLKHCLMEFKDQKVKLNRKTLRAVMVQVCVCVCVCVCVLCLYVSLACRCAGLHTQSAHHLS